MQTRLNPETTAISNDYTKKLREEVESNNKRIGELSVFINSLKAYEKETRLLMDRNTGLLTVIDSINCSIMKSIDEASLTAPAITGDMTRFAMQTQDLPFLSVKNLSSLGGTLGQIRS